MPIKTIKYLMLPLTDYAIVNQDANLPEVLEALKVAEARLQPQRQPPRAVLVCDDHHRIVGQLGYLDFLEALEPEHIIVGESERLAVVGLDPDFVSAMMKNYQLLDDDLENICRRALNVKVKDVMRPLTESLDENIPLTTAVHYLVNWQTPRILVTSQGEVIGILRVADVFKEVVETFTSILKS
jgi:CBS-domain-containing membrane protein